ncbi:MAG: aminoacyl-tRNA hydrolase [Candidatus Adiutrix sp.]|jgi:ribosome-associated protein|nr:aminoacyl-tRNA hydrolase [Candidatus Adiutrix sp.]
MNTGNDKVVESAALEIKFIHAGGPGGQNVNKVSTCAQLSYDLNKSGLSPGQLSRLAILAPSQISRQNVLIITARNHRSQALNRTEAVARLTELLKKALVPPPRPRRATRPTRRAVERRLEDKKRRGAHKAARRVVRGDEE